ncbi:hypothetical protein QQP08_016276 [Theobroma cacao]|nr:hypothetical protein QQP08_016276 [Theobroma cacao]
MREVPVRQNPIVTASCFTVGGYEIATAALRAAPIGRASSSIKKPSVDKLLYVPVNLTDSGITFSARPPSIEPTVNYADQELGRTGLCSQWINLGCESYIDFGSNQFSTAMIFGKSPYRWVEFDTANSANLQA